MNYKNKLQKYILICFLFINTFFLIYYLFSATKNVVFMDYWRLSERLIPLVCNNELTFSDLWSGDWGQRNPLQLALFCLNIKYFNLNAMIPVYLGAGTICIYLFLYLQIYIKRVFKPNSMLEQIVMFTPIVLCAFCLNQWEIMETQFSFPYYLRIFMYAIVIYLVDVALMKKKKRQMLLACIIMPFATCVLSQLYFWGVLFSVTAILLMISITDKSQRRFSLNFLLYWIISNTLGIMVYFYGLGMDTSGGNFIFFIKSIFSGKAFQAFFNLLGSSILQAKAAHWSNTSSIVTLGGVLSIIIGLCIYEYYKKKMYFISYMPILCILYGLFSMGAIMYGRMSKYEVSSFASSRYTVDTTILWIGCLSVLAYSWQQSRSKIILHIIIFISCSYIVSDYDIFAQREYKAYYKENIALMCLDIEKYTDEDLAIMQANSPDMVRNGCSLMQQFHLNVFNVGSERVISND